MEINIKDKVAIITGAGRGIGKVLAEYFIAEGVKVSLWDNDPDFIASDTDFKYDKKKGILLVNCDVSKENDVKNAIGRTVEAYGRIDILIANAGIARFSRVIDMELSDWERVFAVNTKGVFLCSKAVIPEMKKNKFGRIIIASSFASILPSAHSAAYASSKSALVTFTRVLASEVGSFNITVNAYAPGMIPTQMSGIDNMTPERQQELLDTLCIREWGSAEDIASLCIFLSSEKARYITGTLIDASGGKFSVQFNKYA